MRGEARMDFNIDFNLFRSQKLLLSPHLKQAMEILEMDTQQLSAYIQEQAEANPVLEVNYGEEFSGEEQVYTEEDTPAGVTLKEYLLLQLDSLVEGKLEKSIGEYLIDNTDENGYLKTGIDEAAAFFNTPAVRIVNVLNILQSLEPPGICARNLKECLLIQLKQYKDIDKAALEIVEKYLDRVAEGDAAAVAEAMGLNKKEVSEIFSFIKTLEPRPGREFYPDDGIRPAVADVLVEKINNGFIALMNEDAIPAAGIGDYCEKIGTDDISNDDEVFIRGRLDNAIWLIKCIEQRKNVIFRIAELIVKEQQSFFEGGFSYLKSIDPKHISSVLDIHESLVQLALKGKYLQCSWGIFELPYFCKA